MDGFALLSLYETEMDLVFLFWWTRPEGSLDSEGHDTEGSVLTFSSLQ